MVGSGMPETFELSELLKYVLEVVTKYQRPLVIPSELGEMVDKINDALDEFLSSRYEDADVLPEDVPKELFKYWVGNATLLDFILYPLSLLNQINV